MPAHHGVYLTVRQTGKTSAHCQTIQIALSLRRGLEPHELSPLIIRQHAPGLYCLLLDIETTPPDRVRQYGRLKESTPLKLVPAPGFAEHPIFAGLEASKGIYTNSNDTFVGRPTSLLVECAWDKATPAGVVLAGQVDSVNLRSRQYAAVVEYRPGKGKVLVLGGLAVNMNPGFGHEFRYRLKLKGIWPIELRGRIRTLALNALCYLASPEPFKPPAEPSGAGPLSP